MGPTRKQALLYAVLPLLALGLLELRIFVMTCAGYAVTGIVPEEQFNASTYLTPSPVRYDPIRGFRWSPGTHRIFRQYNRETVFDSKFSVNRQGYLASFDFTRRKPAGTFRIAVLGDSYTGAEFLPTAWPARAQQMLNESARPGNPKIEIYNFANNGGEAENWYYQFFEEIVPQYDFDAVVLSSSSNFGISRGFFAMDSDAQGVNAATFPQRPSTARQLEIGHSQTPDEKAGHVMTFATDAEMNYLKGLAGKWKWQRPRWYLTRKLIEKISGVRTGHAPSAAATSAPAPGPARVSDPEIQWRAESALSSSNLDRLIRIVQHCRDRRIPVVLALVPDRVEWEATRALGNASALEQGWASFARAHGASFFDGFPLYGDEPPAVAVRKYWLKYDWHWNQLGSDRFAARIATFVQTNLIPAPAGPGRAVSSEADAVR